MATILGEILYGAAETDGYECNEAQVERFIQQIIREDKISETMVNNDSYLDFAGKSWIKEFKLWLQDQLTIEYQVLDGGSKVWYKIVCERLDEAQLVWDTLVYLRNKYRIHTGRPF